MNTASHSPANSPTTAAAPSTAVFPPTAAFPPVPDMATGGAYELIRERLSRVARALAERLAALNQARAQAFGSTRLEVIGRVRVRTENQCVPRDIKAFGHTAVDGNATVSGQPGGGGPRGADGHPRGVPVQQLLLGYNVFVGLRPQVQVADVFSLHRVAPDENGELAITEIPLSAPDNPLNDKKFIADFEELYRYYKDTRLSQLRALDEKRLMVFQTGRTLKDSRVFRWQVDRTGQVRYIDNRGERDHVYPPPHDFTWRATSREQHVAGPHPHVSILDQIFVETVGGDLTVKIENNTATGAGIYSEPVIDPNQSLADAQIFYAQASGLILLKIRPYKEEDWRYLVYNPRLQRVARIDAIGRACVCLPEDHGLIFPGGYYLLSGEHKSFDGTPTDLTFKRMLRAPNGEDALYVFHHEVQGLQVLYAYNLIRKETHPPIVCHGFSLFPDGRMVVFRADNDTPAKVHPMQIWQTPFGGEEHMAAPTDSTLGKIGNAELVRGISDGYTLTRMVDQQQSTAAFSPTRQMYEDLIAHTRRVLDTYHWLEHPGLPAPLAPLLKELLDNAERIIDEFEKAQAQRRQASEALAQARAAQQKLLEEIARQAQWTQLNEYLSRLAALRTQRGRWITLRETRYLDLPAVDALEREAAQAFSALGQATVEFMLQRNALDSYAQALHQHSATIAALTQSQQAEAARTALNATAAELETLTQALHELPIADPNARARLLEAIAEVYAALNRANAELELKRKSLSAAEARAEFAAQFKLLAQSVAGALAAADTPEQADAQWTRLAVQLEELESRFGEYDEYLAQLAEKREEIQGALQARKQQLQQERQQRAQHWLGAAERIVQGIVRRARELASVDEQNAFFAADAMVLKLRDIIAKLEDLGERVKAGELLGRLRAAREQAIRELRDRRDIFSQDGSLIQLGNHRFSVNTQPLELSLLAREYQGEQIMALHVAGTDFFQPLEDAEFAALQPYWQQSLVSETPELCRAEYLAGTLLLAAESDVALASALRGAKTAGTLTQYVRQVAAERYEEGYERGVHDADAAMLLDKLLPLAEGAGLLRYPPRCRALGQLFWAAYEDDEPCEIWAQSALALQQIRTSLGGGQPYAERLVNALHQAIAAFVAEQGLVGAFTADEAAPAAEYLLEELANGGHQFTASNEALRLVEAFTRHLGAQHATFTQTLAQLRVADSYALAYEWLASFAKQAGTLPLAGTPPLAESALDTQFLAEAAVIVLTT